MVSKFSVLLARFRIVIYVYLRLVCSQNLESALELLSLSCGAHLLSLAYLGWDLSSVLSITGSSGLKFLFGSSVFFVLLILGPVVIVFLLILVNFVTHCLFICLFDCLFVCLLVCLIVCICLLVRSFVCYDVFFRRRAQALSHAILLPFCRLSVCPCLVLIGWCCIA